MIKAKSKSEAEKKAYLLFIKNGRKIDYAKC